MGFITGTFTRIFAFACLALAMAQASAAPTANPGISYSGRIMAADGVTPVTSPAVSFSVAIYDINKQCLLFTETRTLDLSGSGGSFSFDIGDGSAGATASYKGNVTDINGLFNNTKAFTGLTCLNPPAATSFTALAANEPRLMMVSFDTGDGNGPQTLPALKINPVPSALQAYNLNGYGTGDLLRIDLAVDKTLNANTDLSQTQYDEFWRLVKNPSTAYLTTATAGALAGDVTGAIGSNSVVKIRGVAVSATAPTAGQVLTLVGTTWTPTTPAASGVASVVGTLPISVSGTSTSTVSISQANSTTDGYLTSANWNTFNNKLASALASANMWVGNSGGAATAVSMSGDATMTNTGSVGITAGAITAAKLSSGGVVSATSGILIAGTTGNIVNQTCTTNGQVLQWTVTGWACGFPLASLPSLTDGKMWLGNSGNAATAVTMSGDASISNAGVVTLATTGVVAGTFGKVVVDAKGRVTAGQSLLAADITGALTYTPVNKAGDTMSGALAMGANDITNTGNINMAANKYFGLSANTTPSTTAGQMWYDTGVIKYFDGSVTRSLGVAGAGITNLNGLSAGTQTFSVGTAGTDFVISSSTATHTFNLPNASATNRGALTPTDWTSFNSKMTSSLTSANIWVGNSGGAATAVAMTGDTSINNTGLVTLATTGVTAGTYGKVTVDAKGRVTAGSAFSVTDLPALASTKIWVGNSGSAATPVSVTGDASMDNAGVVTLASTGVVAGSYAKVAVDAKGRVTAGQAMLASDITTALAYTPVNKAGDTMVGALAMGANDISNTGNINMAANKYFGLSANSTPSTTAGQMWYDSGVIKYYDGSITKSLGVAGAGITNLNGLSAGTQSFAVGTAGTDFAINSVTSTHTFNIPNASATNRGALTSADWTSFNGKLSSGLAAAKIWVGNSGGAATAVSLSGDATVDNAGVLTIGAGAITAPKLSSGGIVSATTGILMAGPTGNLVNQTCVTNGHVLQWSVTGWVCGAPVSALPSLTDGKMWLGNSGNAATAVTMSGDASITNAGVVTLASTGVVAGSYAKVAVDAKGRVTAGQSMTSSDITTPLGFTPSSGGLSSSLASTNIYVGNSSGGAVAVGMTGDATLSNAGVVTLASTGVVAGSYAKVAVDAKGRVTAGQSMISSDITTALGYTPTNGAAGFIQNGNSFGADAALGTVDNYNLTFKTNNTTKMFIGNNGYVGIGTVLPGVALEVAGQVKITGGTPGLGKVLTSDAAGLASWGTPAAGGLSTSLASSNIYVGNATGGAVAVGVSGDATLSNSGVLTLATTGVTAASYAKVTVDAKGRVTSGTTLAASDITTALTYTPFSNAAVIPIANGGTAGITAAAARTNLSAAQSGANTDITSMTPAGGVLTLSPTTAIVTSAVMKAPVGTAAAPVFTNSTDTSTGMYFPITGTNIGFSIGGTSVMSISSTGVNVTGAATSTTVVITSTAAVQDAACTTTGAIARDASGDLYICK
jgi:phage-related tail fiber protein